MGNCYGLNKKPSSRSIGPSETPPTIKLLGRSDETDTMYLRFALTLKPVALHFVPTNSQPVIQFRSDTVSGSLQTILHYVESCFPDPTFFKTLSDETVSPVVEAAVLHHRSLTWQVERLARWTEDLVVREGKASEDPAKGSSRMEVKKYGHSYSQLLEFMLEHAQMEERVIFPILERGDRGSCKLANEDHARDLPIMNGISEDIKSLGVLDSGNSAYQEALFSLYARIKTLQENCKEHFEEEERDLLPLIEAAELTREQHQKVLEQCFDAMQSTHSHLFCFFIEGLLPHDALHYIDLITRHNNQERTGSILHLIIN